MAARPGAVVLRRFSTSGAGIMFLSRVGIVVRLATVEGGLGRQCWWQRVGGRYNVLGKGGNSF